MLIGRGRNKQDAGLYWSRACLQVPLCLRVARVRYGDIRANRKPLRIRLADQVADKPVLCHEAVWVVAGIRFIRQIQRPVRRVHAETVPSLVAPALADLTAFENAMFDAVCLQTGTCGQSSVSGTNDDNVRHGLTGVRCRDE